MSAGRKCKFLQIRPDAVKFKTFFVQSSPLVMQNALVALDVLIPADAWFPKSTKPFNFFRLEKSRYKQSPCVKTGGGFGFEPSSLNKSSAVLVLLCRKNLLPTQPNLQHLFLSYDFDFENESPVKWTIFDHSE